MTPARGSRWREWLAGELPVMDRYFLLSWLVLMASGWRQFKCIEYTSWVEIIFAAVVFITYCFLYIIPARLLVHLAEWLARRQAAGPSSKRHIAIVALAPYALAVFLTATADVLAFTDYLLYRADGHHVTDTFVLNVILRPGGLNALGADTATKLTFAAIILAFILLQATILAALIRWRQFSRWTARVMTAPRLAAFLIIVAAMFVWQAVIFGFSRLNGYLPIVEAADAIPMYVPVTYGHMAKRLGYEAPESKEMRLRINIPRNIAYPLQPLHQSADHRNFNIVWMLGESLRFDMLEPNIMPHTCSFAAKAVNFRQHYSSGNGTRMAIFGMFYGLYGNYWWAFLNQERGPVLMDVLLGNNYQMCMMTSSNFRYPEFLQTVFVRLPHNVIHEDNPYPEGWQNDRRNVDRLIDFMSRRDPSRPFMIFMFFESPHSRYHFPPECEIAVPYLRDFNYTTTDITKAAPLIKNRYINSCNHLDSQFERIIEYLTASGLLDSTIVIITGDHGEEFLESGRWGHTSDFTDWQTRVPMILWVPGEAPRAVDRMTSHLDLPATVAKRLGVTNPPEDYSLGCDMLDKKERDYTIVADWYNVACIDHEFKGVFPIKMRHGRQEVTTKNDAPVKDVELYYSSRRPMLLKLSAEMRRFEK